MATYVCTLPPVRPSLLDALSASAAEAVADHSHELTSDLAAAAAPANLTEVAWGGIGGNASLIETTTLGYFRISTTAAPVVAARATKAIRCVDVSWSHIQAQVLIAAIPWVLMTAVGLYLTVRSSDWVSNARARMQRFEFGLASTGNGPALAVMIVHSLQCGAFALRASMAMVDPIYYALETIGTLYILLDVLAGWAYVVTCGKGAVLGAAFSGRWILDMLVTTSVVALGVQGFGTGLTWFSFSFLAAARLMSIIAKLQRLDLSTSQLNWRRHVFYNVLSICMFIFASAAIVMTLEMLEEPGTRGGRLNPAWDLWPAICYVFMSMLTVGNSSLVPESVLGQLFAVAFLLWSIRHMIVWIIPLAKELMAGRTVGLGVYRPPRREGPKHLVILGTASAPMLWDFLRETFHPNHFASTQDFDKFAPHVVLMLPSQSTLAHVRTLLMRRESLLFRSKVWLLQGDAFSPEDVARAEITTAVRVVILPDMSTANVANDDTGNVLRTFQINNIAPNVPVTCMIHMPRQGSEDLTKSTADLNDFVSIDAFKLSLLASACLARGFMTMICNLCKTEGDIEADGQPWQLEYEEGLGNELYEIPLSESYEGVAFAEVAWDVLARSDGKVRLVGLTELQPNRKREVVIHPGADYAVEVARFSTYGVFIAQDLGAIVQCGDRRRLRVHQERNRTRDDEEEGEEEETRAPRLSPQASPKSVAPLFNFSRPPPPSREESERRFATERYGRSLRAIRHRLLARGFRPDLISAVTGVIASTASVMGMGGPAKSEPGGRARARSEPPGRAPEAAQGPARGAGDAAEEPPVDPFQGMRDLQVMGSQALADRLGDLRQLHSRHESMERVARRPPAPPASIVEAGGHLLLCVVEESSAGKGGHADASGGRLGPALGIAHFMRPLRDSNVASKLRGYQDVEPSVVVLAEALPEDWYTVFGLERVFFVRGSPLDLGDLELAAFRKARAIAVVRSHRGGVGDEFEAKVSDAQMVLAAHVIESQLPQDTQIPVLTDHAFVGTCDFLPLSVLVASSYYSGPGAARSIEMPMPPMDALAGLSLRMEAFVVDELGTSTPSVVEDYGALDSTSYDHHPRFMRGDLFATGAITSLVANTLYNPSLVPLVTALTMASPLLLPVPVEWERRSFAEFSHWLLTSKNMLALGIYRSNKVVREDASSERKNAASATMHYMYTSPPAFEAHLFRSDRVLVVAPSMDD